MKIFRIGDIVKLSDELLSYPPNKEWIGCQGTVTKVEQNGVFVQWPHCKVPVYEPDEYIEKV